MRESGLLSNCFPKGSVRDGEGLGAASPALDMSRSAAMSLLQLYIPLEAAQTTLLELGEQGLVQFRDLNESLPASQKHFTQEIVQLSETERKVLALMKAAEGVGLSAAGPSTGLTRIQPKTQQELVEMDRELEEFEARVTQMSDSIEDLQGKLAELEEYKAALLQVSLILTGTSMVADDVLDGASVHSYHQIRTATSSGFVVGVILKRKFNAFERVIWRAMRGNVHIGKADLPASLLGDGVAPEPEEGKAVFVVFAHGSAALGKIRRICEALGCRLYPEVDDDMNRRAQQLALVSAQIEDLSSILYNTKLARRSELGRLAGQLEEQLILARHQRGLYAVMNLLQYDVGRRCLIGEAWCATMHVGRVDEALRRSGERAGMDVSSIMTVLKTDMTPPTFVPRNKFTAVFVEMTEAYGIAAYRESNPALSMIITLPFFFALMYSDLGHAAVMVLLGAVLVLGESRLGPRMQDSELGGMLLSARYAILLMGLFGLYTGLIYNDCLSKSLALFPSMFAYDSATGTSTVRDANYVYPFGIDPLWNHAVNSLGMTNSIKMKGAIIVAVLHMNYGMLLNVSNLVFVEDWAGVLCRGIPALVFFNALFGYLAFLVVYKWCIGVDVSILNSFIAMAMGFGQVPEGAELYGGQELVQTVLMILAVAMVPLMIFGRAGVLLARRREIEAQGYQEASRNCSVASIPSPSVLIVIDADGDAGKGLVPSKGPGTPEGPRRAKAQDVGAVLAHDAIHSIEFFLGGVSNTASYLRLWALSLAHAQLSEVLWGFCVDACAGSALLLVLGYAVFFAASLGLMVGLEGLSAFLHALRLHWVEFNNKFYAGAGAKFEPFQLDAHTGHGVVVAAVEPYEE